MKKYSYLAGAAFLAIASSSSFASITLQVTQLTSAQLTALSLGDPTLSNNGWVGYQLSLVADGTVSTAISAVDFANVVTAQPGMPQSNIGISGDIHQEWNIPKGDGSNTALATSTPDNTTNGLDGYDSFWDLTVGSPGFKSDPNVPTENNNLQGGAAGNPPYTASPIATFAATSKAPGTTYGVGSLMTFAGAYNLPFASSVSLAFIIVPSSVPTTINGVAVDSSATPVDWAITTVLGGVTTPEPASVGLVGLGVLSLLARRRRKI